jgi:DNA-binding transcriptional regulator YiaG
MTAEEIKAVRHKLGLSQAAFAEKLGTQQARVSDWENGKHPISRPFIILIQHFLTQKP